MGNLLIIVINCLILIANLAVLAAGIKLYTEVHKKATIEKIGK